MGVPYFAPTFQSHFGLILSSSNGNSAVIGSLFQSHFGLILSRFRPFLADLSFRSFNPILVWFYRNAAPTASAYETTFQSHFGLILSHPDSILTSPIHSFQSHFGLILSLHMSDHRSICNYLSIPFWSDFITKAADYQAHKDPNFQLSIPFWSDFIWMRRKRTGVWLRFQSHFGLILSR